MKTLKTTLNESFIGIESTEINEESQYSLVKSFKLDSEIDKWFVAYTNPLINKISDAIDIPESYSNYMTSAKQRYKNPEDIAKVAMPLLKVAFEEEFGYSIELSSFKHVKSVAEYACADSCFLMDCILYAATKDRTFLGGYAYGVDTVGLTYGYTIGNFRCVNKNVDSDVILKSFENSMLTYGFMSGNFNDIKTAVKDKTIKLEFDQKNLKIQIIDLKNIGFEGILDLTGIDDSDLDDNNIEIKTK